MKNFKLIFLLIIIASSVLKLIWQTRFKVKCTFGGIKSLFYDGEARYKGMEKMHTQNLMEAVCYNLHRNPGIVASNCKN